MHRTHLSFRTKNGSARLIHLRQSFLRSADPGPRHEKISEINREHGKLPNDPRENCCRNRQKQNPESGFSQKPGHEKKNQIYYIKLYEQRSARTVWDNVTDFEPKIGSPRKLFISATNKIMCFCMFRVPPLTVM